MTPTTLIDVFLRLALAAGLGAYSVAAAGAALTLVVLALLPLAERIFEERGGGGPH